MWYVARSHRRYAAVGARKKCLGAMHPWRPRSSLSTTSSRRPRTAGASSMLCARACASARTRAFHPVHTLTFSLAAGCRRMNISSNEGARPSSSAPSGPTAPPPAPLLLSPPLSSPLAVFALAASASFASCPLPLPLPPLPPLLHAAPAPKPAPMSRHLTRRCCYPIATAASAASVTAAAAAAAAADVAAIATDAAAADATASLPSALRVPRASASARLCFCAPPFLRASAAATALSAACSAAALSSCHPPSL